MRKGGLRISPTVNREEIERLALVMDKKCKHYNLPYAGAKAGIIYKGQNKRKLIKEFFTILKDLGIFHSKYVTAPDIGTNSQDMDFIVKTFGKGSATRTSAGIPHGSGLTGYGIALVALREIKKLNK